MTVPKEIQDAFFSGLRSSAVPLCVNDTVEVTAGEQSGSFGAVISQESAGADPMFVVELGDRGVDVTLPLSSLRLVERAGP